MALLRAPRPFLVAALLVTLAALVLPAAPPVAAAPVPDGYTYAHAWYTAHDGIQLHAGVYLPADREPDERHPVILSSTPYTAPNGGALGPGVTSSGVTTRFPELFAHPAFVEGRYAFVAVDVRGFGGSEGCFQYYMPNEAADVHTSVEWAAEQPWSDGNVGMWGKSYDGAQMVLGLGVEPPSLDAVVIQAPGLSGYTALWMNGVHYATGRYATTSVYTADDLFPAQNRDTAADPNYGRAAAAPATAAADYPTCRSDQVVMMNTVADRDDPFWADKEPYRDAADSAIPTFWLHGFFDANTKPVHTDIWSTLTNPGNRAWFGQFSHLRGHEQGVGRGEHFLDEAFRFLDEHVRGITPQVEDAPVTVQEGSFDGRWRHEARWPPADAETWTMELRNGSYLDGPGNTGDGPGAGQNGYWTVTPELPHDVHLAGEPVFRMSAPTNLTGEERVVVHLYDIDEFGEATLMTRGASLVAAAEDTAFALYPQDWMLREGHRIGVHISGADDDWFSPGTTQQQVAVIGASIDVPLLAHERTEFIDGGLSDGHTSAQPFEVEEATLEAAEHGGVPPAQRPR